jgi:hypothetical protein
MQLFPYILVRIAGLPFDMLERYSQFSTLDELYQQLQIDIQHPIIQQALPYSSIDFLQYLHCFIDKDPNSFRKKEFQKARTALKYITRTAAKCSPFADFTTLGLIHWNYDEPTPNVTKHLINIDLLAFFCKQIIENQLLKEKLAIRKNPTLHYNGEEWAWILNIENQEHLQCAEDDGLLSFLLEFIENQRVVRYSEVKKFLIKNTSKAKKWQHYFDQLFEVGILEFDFPFGKNQQGFEQLQLWLQTNEPQGSSNLLDILNWLLSIKANNQLNINTLVSKNELLNQLGYDARSESLLFKDIAQIPPDADAKIKANEHLYTQSAHLYTQLAQALLPLTYDKLKNMVFECLTKVETQQQVPFFELYKDIFHHEHLFSKKQAELIQQNRQNAELWLAQNIDFQEDKINISSNDLMNFWAHTSSMTSQAMMQLPPSANLVLQPLADGKLVLNGASIGYGKQFLRFLHLFDNQKLIDIFQLKNISNKQYLELNDSSFISANEHIPLADFALDAPNTLHQHERFSILNIEIEKNEEGKFLLRNKENQQVIIPLDLGLEHPNRRSPLYQLLMSFGESLPNFRIFNDLLNNCFEKSYPNVSYYPEIVIDNQLIIQRKHWFFDVSNLPIQQNNEPKVAYAERVKKWAKSKQLPQHIFVSVPFEMNTDDIEKLLPDDYKPQYIDLNNILLIDLFGKIIKRASEVIKVEVMQPEPSELMIFEGQKRVFEIVIQHTF